MSKNKKQRVGERTAERAERAERVEHAEEQNTEAAQYESALFYCLGRSRDLQKFGEELENIQRMLMDNMTQESIAGVEKRLEARMLISGREMILVERMEKHNEKLTVIMTNLHRHRTMVSDRVRELSSKINAFLDRVALEKEIREFLDKRLSLPLVSIEYPSFPLSSEELESMRVYLGEHASLIDQVTKRHRDVKKHIQTMKQWCNKAKLRLRHLYSQQIVKRTFA